jgi:tetratricopeptide (TPR) repeat protein
MQQTIIERADSLYSKGQCDQAIGLLSTAFEADTLKTELTIKLAELLIDSDQHRLALKFLLQASLGESDTRVLSLRGLCSEALGQFAEAQRIADSMLRLHRQDANALVIKGRIAFRSGDPALAEKLFRDALASDPGCAMAYSGLGYLHRDGNNCEASLDCFEKAFRACPSSREIAIAFHDTATGFERHSRAETALRQALSSQPLNRRLRFLLIDILLRQSKFGEAMSEIESSMVDFGFNDGILSAALNVRQQLGALRITDGQRTRNTVSLCMIVKNEQKHLARCLHSAKPVVDEMVIVDTGSEDRTKDIAVAYGAMAFDFPWVDDFSKARNFSLSKASGDWILVLDADEVISSQNYDEFRALVQTPNDKPLAYCIQTRNYTHRSNTFGWKPNKGEYPNEEGTGWFSSDKVRLFTNDARIRFANPVHELVEPCLSALNIPIHNCSIPVHHFGKLEEAKTYEKTKAYSDLGQKKLKKNRRSLSALKELAIQSAHLGKHKEALSLWKQFLKLQSKSAEACLNMGTACWNLARYSEAVSFADKALRLDPTLKEAQFDRAISLLMLGRAEEAKSILQKLLQQHPDYPAAQFMLCVVHASAGERQHVESSLEKIRVTPLGPYLGESFLDVAKRLYAASQIEYAMRTLETASHFNYTSDEMSALLETCRAAA